MALFPNATNTDYTAPDSVPDLNQPFGARGFAGGGFTGDLLGAWWRLRRGGKFGTPYELLRPVNPDSTPPAAAPTMPPAVPLAPVPQLLGRFTTRRTQLFGPFANLM